jgi:hypothetical protein
MLNAAALRQCRGLRAEHFALDSHQRIFRALTALIAEGIKEPHHAILADRLAEAGELEKIHETPRAFLAGLTEDLPHHAEIAYHAGRIVELSGRREALRLCAEFSRRFESGEDVEATVAQLQAKLREIRSRSMPDLGDERISTSELLEAVREWIRRFMVLSDAQATICAVWVLHAWAIDTARFSPPLHVKSPTKECGKSRLLEVLKHIVPRPWPVVQPTAAVLRRKIDRDGPTILLDENDNAMKGPEDYKAAILTILNCGFDRNGPKAALCEKQNGKWELVELNCFCAKVIAGIGDMLPDTTVSRCFPIDVQKKTRTEKVEALVAKNVTNAEILCGHLEKWAASDLVQTLCDADPEIPKELSDRQQDVSAHPLAIADLAGGAWPEKVRRALLEIFGSATVPASPEVELLRDICTVFAERNAERIFSADLALGLNAMDDAQWRGWNQGKGISPHQVAHRLKAFGIEPCYLRIGGPNRRGYLREVFGDAWSRYALIPPSQSVTAVTTRMDIDDSRDFGSVTDFPRHTLKNASGPA